QQFPFVDVLVRGNRVRFEGPADDVDGARRLVEELVELVRNGGDLVARDVMESARILADDRDSSPSQLLGEAIISSRGRTIRPKTMGQRDYVDAIDHNTIVFGI